MACQLKSDLKLMRWPSMRSGRALAHQVELHTVHEYWNPCTMQYVLHLHQSCSFGHPSRCHPARVRLFVEVGMAVNMGCCSGIFLNKDHSLHITTRGISS